MVETVKVENFKLAVVDNRRPEPQDFNITIDRASSQVFVPRKVMDVVAAVACNPEPTFADLVGVARSLMGAFFQPCGWERREDLTAARENLLRIAAENGYQPPPIIHHATGALHPARLDMDKS